MDLDHAEEVNTDHGGKGTSNVLYTFCRGSSQLICLDAVVNLFDADAWLMKQSFSRDTIGSSCVLGDSRWAGSYGVKADFIAQSHCSVEFIPVKAILVCHCATVLCLVDDPLFLSMAQYFCSLLK